MIPIVNDVTVGMAMEQYQHECRPPRGVYLSIDHAEVIEETFANLGVGPGDIDLIVATDAEHGLERANQRTVLIAPVPVELFGLGVLAAVVYKVLARVAPWLFCRNVNKVGRAVCGLNPETLNSLLALALGTLVITDLRSLVQAAEAIESEITGEIKNILNA